jgi:hypothetical protein
VGAADRVQAVEHLIRHPAPASRSSALILGSVGVAAGEGCAGYEASVRRLSRDETQKGSDED